MHVRTCVFASVLASLRLSWYICRSKATVYPYTSCVPFLNVTEFRSEFGPHVKILITFPFHLSLAASIYRRQPRVRLFLVLGEAPAEGYLLEVPAQLSSLRSQGALLALQYTNGNGSSDNAGLAVQKAWMWYGMYASETTINVARHIVERLKQRWALDGETNQHFGRYVRFMIKYMPPPTVVPINVCDLSLNGGARILLSK